MTRRSDGAASAAGAQTFFERGDRRTHLEQLRHLSQWSRRILLVTGPRGVGKSTLYRHLSATLEPRAKAARINGTLVNGAREVLAAVAHGFGLAASAEADTQLLRELIADHARSQERSERFCVTLIDDAELLEPRALEHLIALTESAPLRVVLFGEVRLVPAVERLADPRGLGWHEIRLTGFGPGDVRKYLEWRLRALGHTEEVRLSSAQIGEIARLSEGLPGRIDQMANVLLTRIRNPGSEAEARRFPASHKALLAVLVVVLGLIYLLWRPLEPADPQLVRTEPLPLPGRLASAAAAATAESAPSADDAAAPTAGRSEPAPVEPPAAPAQTETAAATRTETAAVTQAQTPAARPTPTAAVAPGAALADPAPNGPAPAAGARPSPAAAPAEADTAATGEPPAATKASESSSSQPAAADDGPRTAEWIMRQRPESFTLQLASFSSAGRADAYLSGQDRPTDFARYRLQRDGRILHVVIYGAYDSREAAERASGRLPGAVGDVKPWIRTFAQVQDAVRTALQPATAGR